MVQSSKAKSEAAKSYWDKQVDSSMCMGAHGENETGRYSRLPGTSGDTYTPLERRFQGGSDGIKVNVWVDSNKKLLVERVGLQLGGHGGSCMNQGGK